MLLRSGKRTKPYSSSSADPIGNDAFAKLPEELIQSIISHLPIKEAVKTSLVSKKWRFRWRKHLNLDLDLSQIYQGNHRLSDLRLVGKALELKYVEWVNNAVRSHQGGNIETVRISTTLPCEYSAQVDQWIRFAFDKRVSNLAVDLSKYVYNDTQERYVIPDWFVSYGGVGSNLRSLSLGSVELGHLEFGRFWLLQSLTLRKVHVKQELVDGIMSNCVKLEHLALWKCFGPAVIKFKVSKQLKHLGVSGYLDSLRKIEISDACTCSLESVECVGNSIKSHLFKPISTLKKLSIVGGFPDEISGLNYVTSGLPYHVANLKTLHMCMYSIVLEYNRFEMPVNLPTFNKLRHLVLYDGYGETRTLLKLVTIFLRMMPFLHYLDLSHHSYVSRSGKIKLLPVESCTHNNLKVIKTNNFVYHQGVNLIVYFLQNATNLERIEIHRKKRIISRDSEGCVELSSCNVSPKTIERWFRSNVHYHAKLEVC
uniref:F-box domain-containing protein n=1 Tax=Kalanchoe fedtschenkoi TaxID=63787 RepID=A0A7N0UAA0_KALFE